jgi:hypothetical protein
MLCMQIDTAYSENRTKHIHIPCQRRAELPNSVCALQVNHM